MANQITRGEPVTLTPIPSNVIKFAFKSHEVRTLLIDSQPWFVARDVAEILGYSNTRKAIQDHCKAPSILKSNESLPLVIPSRGLTIIAERDVYRMIMRSKLPAAEAFEDWVVSEVLPAIRKQGHYNDSQGRMNTLIGQTIGTDGFRCLGAILDGKVKHLEPALRTRAKQHIWSQVHKAFSVVSAQDIPAGSLDAVRNFIGAYALEGEYLPKQQRAPFPEEKIAYLATWNKIAYHRYRQLDDLSKQLNDLAKKVEAVKSNLYDPIAEPSMSLTPYVDQDRVERLLDMQDRRRS